MASTTFEHGAASHTYDIAATLLELADTLVSDYDLLDYVDRLLTHTVAVTGADAGAVMLCPRGPPEPLQLLSATNERARALADFDLGHDGGPLTECYRTAEPVREGDLARTDRWPRFARRAVEQGFVAVHGVPMRLRGTCIGVLGLYGHEAGSLGGDVGIAQAFADMATIGIMQNQAVTDARRLAGQLQEALESRVVIEQAKGLLAERLGCPLDDAYALIRRYGRNHNRPLREVAADVVAGTLGASELTAVS